MNKKLNKKVDSDIDLIKNYKSIIEKANECISKSIDGNNINETQKWRMEGINI
jgi:hypothetical protein